MVTRSQTKCVAVYCSKEYMWVASTATRTVFGATGSGGVTCQRAVRAVKCAFAHACAERARACVCACDLIQNRLLLRPDTVDGWGTTNTLGLRTRAKQCTTWRTPLRRPLWSRALGASRVLGSMNTSIHSTCRHYHATVFTLLV